MFEYQREFFQNPDNRVLKKLGAPWHYDATAGEWVNNDPDNFFPPGMGLESITIPVKERCMKEYTHLLYFYEENYRYDENLGKWVRRPAFEEGVAEAIVNGLKIWAVGLAYITASIFVLILLRYIFG